MSVYSRCQKSACRGKDNCRHRRWYYEFNVRGVRHQGSIPEARTKWGAEQAEVKIRRDVFERRYDISTAVAPRLADFIQNTYLPWSRANKRSWRHDEFRSRPLVEHLGKRRMDEITRLHVERFKQDRAAADSKRGGRFSPASVNREIELLSGVYTLAIDSGHVLVNPCRKVRRLDEDNGRARVLSHEEEGRLMAQCTGRRGHLGPVIQLAIHTMLRRSELLSLRKHAIDFERGLIQVMNSRRERTKSKRTRAVPMNSVARSILLELCEKGEGEYLFPNRKTGGHIRDVKTAFNSACEDAGVEGLTFHDLRRTGATRLGEGGANAFYISAVLGHADVRTSEIYTVATNEGLRRAMESLVTQRRESPYLSPAGTKTAAG